LIESYEVFFFQKTFFENKKHSFWNRVTQHSPP
jgi:hypothetical protein